MSSVRVVPCFIIYVAVLLRISLCRERLPERLYHYTDLTGGERIRETGVLKGSTPTTGHAKFGNGVYVTAIDPANRKKAILDNNYGRESPRTSSKADFLVELDVPSLQQAGYKIEAANARGRDVYKITSNSDIDINLGKVDHRILAKNEWLTKPNVKMVKGDSIETRSESYSTMDGGTFHTVSEQTSQSWKVLACVGRTCGEFQGHWLEWKAASSYYKMERLSDGWKSTSWQQVEHAKEFKVDSAQCSSPWLRSSAPPSRKVFTNKKHGTTIEETGSIFKTRTNTVEDVVRQGSCTNDVCTIHKSQTVVADTRSEGWFVDQHQIKQTTCFNDVCSVKQVKQSTLAAPAKAGIGATVSSALMCTGQHLQRNEATLGSWAEECIPAALASGSLGFVIGALSKVPLVGPAIPIAMQVAGVIDACRDATGRCSCEITRTLTMAGPSVLLGATVPGGWFFSAVASGTIGGLLPQCSN